MIDRDRWRVIEPLLDHALALSDEEEREKWLRALRARTPALAADVEALLAGEAAADARAFLDSPLAPPAESPVVGGYVIERALGTGGTSSVWVAHPEDRPDVQVALKLLDLTLRGAVAEERFRREGATLARLAHPGIVRLLESGLTATGEPFLVLELVDGEPIDEYARRHRLSIAERVALVLQVLDALAYAHAARIVHRDIKPSNVLVRQGGAVTLLDFGIAKLLDSAGVDARRSLTTPGVGPMTPAFAAPEQLLGGSVTAATDLYVVGVLLYLLVTGRHPTAPDHASVGDALRALVEAEPPPTDVPRLDPILARALHKTPAERYPSAASFAAELEAWLREHPRS